MAHNDVDEEKVMVRVTDLISPPTRMLPPIKGYEEQPLLTLEQAIQPLILLVPDIEHMVWTVKQNCHTPADHLSVDESASIMLYTLQWEPPDSSFYFILNTTLRTEHRHKLRPWFSYLRLVMFALAKLPPMTSRTIYRGVKVNLSDEYVKNKTFVWWSFSSCTSTIEVIKHFLGDKGHRTIVAVETDSAKDISRHSFYGQENEILLYPARQMRMMSSINLGNDLHMIQLQEVQPPFPLIHIPRVSSIIAPPAAVQSVVSSHRNEKVMERIDKCQPHSEIKLSLEGLTDEDMHIVVREAIVNKQCKYLSLDNNKITSVGMSILTEALNGNSTLERLIVAYNEVGDEGVRVLAKTLSLNHSSLKSLFLEETGITDEGVKYLSDMLVTNSTLKTLWLENNKIGDRGVQLLADTLTRYNKTLKYLFLGNNPLVGDGSVDSLVQMLQQHHSLSSLSIKSCSLSKKGKQRLRQAALTNRYFDLSV